MGSYLKAHLGLAVFALVVALFAVYEVVTTFVAYTWDGYVTSDVVRLAPEVEGRLAHIAVRRDQAVAAGDLLFELDPRPYQIAVAKAEAALALARADAQAAQAQIGVAAATLTAAQARRSDAQERRRRYQALISGGAVTTQQVDDVVRDDDTAAAAVASAKANEAAAQSRVAVEQAAIGVAEATLAAAQYDLSRTKVFAPTGGFIAPYVTKSGDYVEAGTTVLALVTNDDWRVVANLQEQYVDALQPGRTVYVRLASDPWTLHHGTVRSVARGVSRSPDPTNALPFVSLDTDWIRLQRRFPVEITLGDLPARRDLFHGADASVLIFLGAAR